MQEIQYEAEPVAALLSPRALELAVASSVAAVQGRRSAVVALRCGGESVVASAPSGASSSTRTDDAPLRVGCIAKLLTATLARRAFAEREIAPDTHLLDLLPRRHRLERLEGITVRQLLEHTHGLDDSLLERVPRGIDGRVDTDAVLRAMLVERALAPPGAVYSYGGGGPGLVAALLERVTGQSFPRLLRSGVLTPLGLRPFCDDSGVCPATGGSLALCVRDLLRVIAAAALDAEESWPDDDRCGRYGQVTPLPGWNPLERGVYLGWKYHGRGWVGHQSVWPSASIFARAHPARRLALVVASRDHAAAVVAARVFGDHLPELFHLRPGGAPADGADCAGTYRSAAWRVSVAADAAGFTLRETNTARDAPAVSHRLLVPAAGGICFTRPSSRFFPYVQLASSGRSPATVFIWNGRFVLPRVTS